jgi:hypothetical protein
MYRLRQHLCQYSHALCLQKLCKYVHNEFHICSYVLLAGCARKILEMGNDLPAGCITSSINALGQLT